MTSHNELYGKYLELLTTKQTLPEQDDIRSQIIGALSKPAVFSFTRNNLLHQYPKNLSSIFTTTIASDSTPKQQSAAKNAFLLGALSKTDPKVNAGWTPLLTADRIADPSTIYFMEQGFIASAESWAPQFRSSPESACLSYVYDDIAQYYMAEYPNRLIQKLNSDDRLSENSLQRSRQLIKRISTRKLSKYNNQPLLPLELATDPRKKVLVCDQSYADASTTFGLIDDSGFESMLAAAIQENTDALVIVKTHPDTSWQPEKRTGYYSDLNSTDNLLVLRDPINPYQLFDLVDKVYIGTSQMGLEALLAGKEVVCFGSPFYAGWGLTDDRIEVPHRKIPRSLEEVFYYFYIWYTIYNLPHRSYPAQIEEVLDYVEKYRPIYVPSKEFPISLGPPKVSVIIPVYGVAEFIESAILSVQKQSLVNIEIIPIDDCSVDGSAEILRRLSSTDERIKPLFLKQNVGQGFARNEGIKHAQGKYIWFLDGDDYLASLKHLENAFTEAEAAQADLVRCRKRIERVEDTSGNFMHDRFDSVESYFQENVRDATYASYPTLLHNRHFCNLLYRREFLATNDITFKTPQWEERAFLLNALIHARSISSIDSDAFVYRIRTDSTARREKTLSDVKHMLLNFKSVIAILKKAGANQRNSPLHKHFCFNITQFVHYLFRGFTYDVLMKLDDSIARDGIFSEIGAALIDAKFDSSCICAEPSSIDKSWLNSGKYALIVASLRSSRFEDIHKAVQGQPYDQAFILNQYLNSPSDEFSSSLNLYARNDMVTSQPPKRQLVERPRIILHIGSSKSGSTHLQHWLNTNRPQLLSQGIYYPEVGLFWQESRPEKTAGHAPFMGAALRQDGALLDHIESAVQLSDKKINTVILSSEAFFLNENSIKLCDYFAGYNVEMIIYLRRQDKWANSQYIEFVSGGAVARVSQSIEDWLNNPLSRSWLSYRTLLNTWESVIGKNNMTVRIFEKEALIGESIEVDFARSVGIALDDSFSDIPENLSNTSTLNRAYTELVRSLNQEQFSSDNSYFSFIADVHEIYYRNNPRNSDKAQYITQSIIENLTSDYMDENAYIARHYLGQPDGSLFTKDLIGSGDELSSTISSGELELILDSFHRHRKTESRLAVNQSISRHQPQALAYTQYNYGYMNWRRRLLVPLLSPLVRKLTSEAELENFIRDPAGFVRLTDTWKTRLTRYIFFP